MSSFISRFKPWLAAMALLAVIETSYYSATKAPRLSWNSFFDINFAQDESVQRLIAGSKIASLGSSSADIIQVGDSSGLHGVMPKVVMASLPGYSYLNLGVATNVGFSGYYNIAKVALRENPNTKYLVLYTNVIGAVPRKLLWHDTHLLMSESIYDEFLRPLRHVIQYPTLHARQDVLGFTYYQNYKMKQKDILLSANRGYRAFDSIYRQSFGWARETDVEGDVPNDIFQFLKQTGSAAPANEPPAVTALRSAPRVTDEKFFDWWSMSEVSYFDHVYDAFANLAAEHGVKLVLIFNPMPEGIKHPLFAPLMDWEAIENGLNRLKNRRPEVVVTSFDFWPDEKFSVFSHVGTPSSLKSSQRVADLLKGLVPSKPDGTAPAQAPWQASAPKLPWVVDFDQPHPGYGFVDDNKLTVSFPMRQMRGKEAFMFADVPPGPQPLKLTLTLREGQEFTNDSQIAVECNGTPLQRTASNVQHAALTWELPPEAANRYLGWLVLRFHRADDAKMLAFSTLKIEP